MSDISVQAEKAHAATLERERSRRWRIDLAGISFVLPFLIFFVLFLVWPVILGLRMSFFNWTISGLGSNQFLGLGNYAELFSDSAFWKALGVTFLFTIISTPLLVVISFALALLVNRAIPARWLFRTVFFAPFVLPVSVVALIWNWLYQPGFGLINGVLAGLGLGQVNWLSDPSVAMIAVIIETVWWTIGFNFVLYLAGMQQIPPELNEVASIDGAGIWARIRWVTVPLLNRTTSLVIILQLIASLQFFLQAYLLFGSTGGPNFSTRGVVEYIYESGFTTFRIGFASAATYVLFVIILIISIGQFMIITRQGREA
jgi:multiple sugar transport system permease protein